MRNAIRAEGVDSVKLDHLLAPYWSTLWGLAARGHWIRHHQPVRTMATTGTRAPHPISLPPAIMRGDLTVSFTPSESTDFATGVEFRAPRRWGWRICRYPELMEFRAMLEDPSDQPWNGRYFSIVVAKVQESTTRTLWLKQRTLRAELSEDPVARPSRSLPASVAGSAPAAVAAEVATRVRRAGIASHTPLSGSRDGYDVA